MPHIRIVAAIATGACLLAVTPANAQSQACDLARYSFDQQQMTSDDARGRLARSLRDTAAQLREAGFDEACGQTLAALDSLLGTQHSAATGVAGATDEGRAARQTTDRRQPTTTTDVSSDVKRLMANAVPLTQSAGDLSFEKLMGLRVYSSTGQNLGEVEDVMIDLARKQHHAVIGLGGFLNLGETRVMVPLSDLKIGPEREAVFVPFSETEAKSQPVVEWRDGNWQRTQG